MPNFHFSEAFKETLLSECGRVDAADQLAVELGGVVDQSGAYSSLLQLINAVRRKLGHVNL